MLTVKAIVENDCVKFVGSDSNVLFSVETIDVEKAWHSYQTHIIAKKNGRGLENFVVDRDQIDEERKVITFEQGVHLNPWMAKVNCYNQMTFETVESVFAKQHYFNSYPSEVFEESLRKERFLINGVITDSSHSTYLGCGISTCRIKTSPSLHERRTSRFQCVYGHRTHFLKKYLNPKIWLKSSEGNLKITIFHKNAEKLLDSSTVDILTLGNNTDDLYSKLLKKEVTVIVEPTFYWDHLKRRRMSFAAQAVISC